MGKEGVIKGGDEGGEKKGGSGGKKRVRVEEEKGRSR